MLLHIFFSLQNVTPKKPAEETALISDVVADSPHKVTYIIGFSLLDFFQRESCLKFPDILGFLPVVVSWLFCENSVEVELAVDSYEVTLMSCQNSFNRYFHLGTMLYIQ